MQQLQRGGDDEEEALVTLLNVVALVRRCHSIGDISPIYWGGFRGGPCPLPKPHPLRACCQALQLQRRARALPKNVSLRGRGLLEAVDAWDGCFLASERRSGRAALRAQYRCMRNYPAGCVQTAGRDPEKLWTVEDYPAKSIEDLSVEVIDSLTEVRRQLCVSVAGRGGRWQPA